MRSLPPFPSRTMSWCWSKSTSLTRSRMHSMSRDPEPYKRLAITHRIPSERQNRSHLLVCEHDR
jgi:hypothetical protein